MPKSNPNSEQIHLVVELSSGIDEEELEDANDGQYLAGLVTISILFTIFLHSWTKPFLKWPNRWSCLMDNSVLLEGGDWFPV